MWVTISALTPPTVLCRGRPSRLPPPRKVVGPAGTKTAALFGGWLVDVRNRPDRAGPFRIQRAGLMRFRHGIEFHLRFAVLQLKHGRAGPLASPATDAQFLIHAEFHVRPFPFVVQQLPNFPSGKQALEGERTPGERICDWVHPPWFRPKRTATRSSVDYIPASFVVQPLGWVRILNRRCARIRGSGADCAGIGALEDQERRVFPGVVADAHRGLDGDGEQGPLGGRDVVAVQRHDDLAFEDQ